LLTDELALVIQSALNDLPEELLSAITLREFDGLSYEEIASVMECPVGTVRSRIFRAREAIDNRLKSVLG
jgi:RNA polymerase sigma-70 factor (ECF subfamily)